MTRNAKFDSHCLSGGEETATREKEQRKGGEKRKFTNTALLPQFAARKGKVGFAN